MKTNNSQYKVAKTLWDEYRKEQQNIQTSHQARDFPDWLEEKQLTTSQRQDKYVELYFKTLGRLERAEAENSALRHRMESISRLEREKERRGIVFNETGHSTDTCDGPGFWGRILILVAIGIFVLGVVKLAEVTLPI